MTFRNIKMGSLLPAALGVCILTSLVNTRATADDWPQWRGLKRDAISNDKGLLKVWPKDGPKLLWQVNDIGDGYSTPVVVGERIYVLSNKGMEDEFVEALDVKTGKQIWTAHLGPVGNPKQQPNYPGSRSTPTVDGKMVYALSSDGDLACVDAASGKAIRHKSLRKDFGGKPGIWAYSESPLLDENKVIVAPGGDTATVVALDKKTGNTIWKSAIPGGDTAGYSSAMAIQAAGSKQIVQYLSKGLVGLDAATGKFLWRYEKSIDTRFGMHAATPITLGDAVFTAAATGGALAKIKGSGGSYTTESAYVEKKVPNSLGGSVRIGDYLYGTSGATLMCMEFATGKIKWEERSVGAGAICFADGNLYVHSENGEVALVAASPDDYQEKGRFTPPNSPDRKQAKAWAHPIIANGRLYIRDLGTLWCYKIKE